MGFQDTIKQWLAYYEEVISLPHQAERKRELRDEEDLFMLLCFSELLGLPNPVSYYTLELYPEMLENFHDWHKRMGMENSPLTGIRCC